MDEWQSGTDYDDRVTNLRLGGGLNGTNVLEDDPAAAAGQNVFSDEGAVDDMDGGAGTDWYIYMPGIDLIPALAGGEQVN
jgi:hypothetical protein